MEQVMKRNGSKEKLSLFHLTWPIFLEVFLFTLMGVADTFMLSALADDAVAGVGAANQFIHITILILEVIGNGASIVVAQYLLFALDARAQDLWSLGCASADLQSSGRDFTTGPVIL